MVPYVLKKILPDLGEFCYVQIASTLELLCCMVMNHQSPPFLPDIMLPISFIPRPGLLRSIKNNYKIEVYAFLSSFWVDFLYSQLKTFLHYPQLQKSVWYIVDSPQISTDLNWAVCWVHFCWENKRDVFICWSLNHRRCLANIFLKPEWLQDLSTREVFRVQMEGWKCKKKKKNNLSENSDSGRLSAQTAREGVVPGRVRKQEPEEVSGFPWWLREKDNLSLGSLCYGRDGEGKRNVHKRLCG